MAQAKLVRNDRGTYVDRGDGRRVLVARPGRPRDVEVLRRFRLEEADVEPDTAGANPPAPQGQAPDPQAPPQGQDPESSPPAGDGDAGGPGDDPFPRHLGGPSWQLSDGSRVKGSREAAEQAEAALRADEGGDEEEGSG